MEDGKRHRHEAMCLQFYTAGGAARSASSITGIYLQEGVEKRNDGSTCMMSEHHGCCECVLLLL